MESNKTIKIGNTMPPRREDQKLIETMKELFNEQNRILAQHGVSLAQNNSSIEQISKGLTVLAAQQETLRTDFNKRWEDLPKLYVPRQEHQAVGLEGRMMVMEGFRSEILKEIAEIKFTLQRSIDEARLDTRKDIDEQKTSTSDHHMTWLFAILTTVLNTAIGLFLHFLPK